VASDHVIIVLGDRVPAPPGIHLISEQCVRRVRTAEALAARGDVRAVILTGWGMSGQSEARQMAALWRGPAVPVVLEEQATLTAENASYTLQMVLAMGGVRRVTVVTSGWHLRTPYFFDHFRDHGIEVHVASAPVRRDEWPMFLRYELRAVKNAPRERRAAMTGAGHGPACGLA
jgi:uncharacterized SAM-binding protein YcdF (DUF218 family)